eukprot:TRINITY_DN18945_c0_g1_i7.p1 TRINITY_DN18945_c0_g1~~TRINITY_DN18945_c0_g1_i7.p1  ORF type:complete len:216 (+),score=33.39 TRINITY_DN18945_c0_g1_i7:99-650(+)
MCCLCCAPACLGSRLLLALTLLAEADAGTIGRDLRAYYDKSAQLASALQAAAAEESEQLQVVAGAAKQMDAALSDPGETATPPRKSAVVCAGRPSRKPGGEVATTSCEVYPLKEMRQHGNFRPLAGASQVYLYYIIENYDNLPQNVVFARSERALHGLGLPHLLRNFSQPDSLACCLAVQRML